MHLQCNIILTAQQAVGKCQLNYRHYSVLWNVRTFLSHLHVSVHLTHNCYLSNLLKYNPFNPQLLLENVKYNVFTEEAKVLCLYRCYFKSLIAHIVVVFHFILGCTLSSFPSVA